MKIFVAGGTGVIGRPLIARLLAKGHAIVALTHSPEEAPGLRQPDVLIWRSQQQGMRDLLDNPKIQNHYMA